MQKRNISTMSFNASLVLLSAISIYLIILLKSKTAVGFMSEPLIFIYTIFVTTFILSRVCAAMLHKNSLKEAIPPEQSLYKPKATFVIPCKNEETSIKKTITKCFSAAYPKDKLEVIVINDGSTDGTLSILKKLNKKYKNLTVVDWKQNRGKRHAMAEGFRLAKGEIIVQLDSDSYIVPKTFKNLITPFQNPAIGAVCALADPENADENRITKMQAAYYFVSFRVLKAAESTFLKVFCCSGCCSAYRKSAVSGIMDKWLQEKFLGLPVTWGDDRALTNWVIKQGHDTIYVDSVKSLTIVPNTLRQFIKQQIRWKKGWFVNSIFASRFIVKRDAFVAFTYFFPLILITLLTPLVATKGLVYNPLIRGILPHYYIAGMLLVSVIITLYYRFLERENKYWPYVFVWSAINMVFLSFILVYSILTIQNRKWGTR